MKKLATLTAAAALVLGFGAGQALAVDLFVDNDGKGTLPTMGVPFSCAGTATIFTKIQDAVDVARAGDTITVCPGRYVEEVIVKNEIGIDRSDIELIGLKVSPVPSPVPLCTITEPSQPCVVAPAGKDAITITAELPGDSTLLVNVIVRGFKATGIKDTASPFAPLNNNGIVVMSNKNFLRSNTAFGNVGHGILVAGDENDIERTNLHDNGGDGIRVTGNDNTLTVIKAHKTFDGIHIEGDDNFVIDSRANSNDGDGIHLTSIAERNTIEENRVHNNDGDGIHVEGDDNIIEKNRVSDNAGDGFSATAAAIDNDFIRNRSNKNGGFGYLNLGTNTKLQ